MPGDAPAETIAGATRCLSPMENPTNIKAREMQKLADLLRRSASETGNQEYITLFLNAALEIETFSSPPLLH
jgi:hypothetical protein